MEAVRKLRVNRDNPSLRITVNLPFPVQRSSQSFQKYLRRFSTSHLAILSRGAEKDSFTYIRDVAQSVRNSDHKVYFMLLRFTGVEVEGEKRTEKRTKCVQDCDDSSLSSIEYVGLQYNYDEHVDTEVCMHNIG